MAETGSWRAKFRRQPYVVQLIWASLALAFIVAAATLNWSLAFIAAATFLLSLAPILFVRRIGVQLPMSFFAGIVIFIYATIFLGEAFDFYNRYAWWDVMLHGGSALGFGLIGFLFVFTMFEGDRYAAPAWAMAFIAFSFAVTIGALWEIFEFFMDQTFGLNMQKSGLVDTMWDLIVDVIGGSFGAFSGFLFLKGRQLGGFTGVLHEFIQKNRQLFRRLRK
ncbi:hypothetical protein GVY41_03965 [Frigidibacter albus]|uniref:DUF2238 domain-containing protein n=1 Tax=Frigidibacter albus TaxID=1465486 RepID=A0A6L8VCW5_9RHOB|nr:hypothetical protein [Frigidibacter albus]MZQ88165.1 hypothetical protein [Frigidibacter albus]NBE30161.1 hypothetical protein [Frigidibacter albus]GGH47094.1 hypothetical protein GCM10011341_07980 [Frigidibacter albus]